MPKMFDWIDETSLLRGKYVLGQRSVLRGCNRKHKKEVVYEKDLARA